jgi:hypothetical protein
MTNENPNPQNRMETFELYAEELPDDISLSTATAATGATAATHATLSCWSTTATHSCVATLACMPTISTILG